MSTRLRKVALAIVALVVIFFALRSLPSPPPTKPSVELKPITVATTKLIGDYERNEITADKYYKGERINFDGIIDSIGRDNRGFAFLLVSSQGSRPLRARFESDGPVDGLQRGQYVKLRCRCAGFEVFVQMYQCEFQ
jgi:hypothetical protein